MSVDPKQELFEERAAIMEFDGGMSRLEAEFKAAEDVGLVKKYEPPSQQQLGFKK